MNLGILQISSHPGQEHLGIIVGPAQHPRKQRQRVRLDRHQKRAQIIPTNLFLDRIPGPSTGRNLLARKETERFQAPILAPTVRNRQRYNHTKTLNESYIELKGPGSFPYLVHLIPNIFKSSLYQTLPVSLGDIHRSLKCLTSLMQFIKILA